MKKVTEKRINDQIRHGRKNARAVAKQYIPRLLAASMALILAQNAMAANDPSNKELYQMIMELKNDQKRLSREAEQARAAAVDAKQRLHQTQQELSVTRDALTKTENRLLQTREQIDELAHAGSGFDSQDNVRVAKDNPGGFKATAELLYLRPSLDRLGYAIVDPKDPPKVNVEPDRGSKLRNLDPDYEAGFRVGAGYSFAGTGTDVALRFSYLDADTSDSVNEPAGGEIVVPNVHLTGPANQPKSEEDADRAEGEYSLDYRVGDLEVGQLIAVGSNLDLRLFGGLRYADLDQEMKARYYGDNFDDVIPGKLKMSSDFDGVGLRIGVDGSWHSASGFGVFGGLATSLLVGDFDVKWTYRNEGSSNPVQPDFGVEDSKDHQLVPVLEANLGISWRKDYGSYGINAEAGYQFEQWFNVYGVTHMPSDGLIDSQLITDSTDLGLHGPFLRLKARF